MTAGLIDFSKPGDSDQPSPSIWGRCARTLLNDMGLGSYVHNAFLGDTATLPGMPNDGTGDTYTYNDGTEGNRVLDIDVSGTDNNGAAIFTRPLGRIRRKAQEVVWYESRIALAALTDQAVFAGIAELDGLDEDIVADDPSNSAQAGLDTVSCFGFVTQQVSSQTTKLDAVYRNGTGDVVTVATDVTNSSALNEVKHPGGVVHDDERGDLVAGTFVKLGVVFVPGLNQVQYFVNGRKVASAEVGLAGSDSTDQASEYGGIVALKTGAGAARTLHVDFIRAAAQVRT